MYVTYFCCLQYNWQIKNRTSVNGTYYIGSHVMQYGDLDLSSKRLSLYIGYNPHNGSATHAYSLPTNLEAIDQRDASLVFFWHEVS